MVLVGSQEISSQPKYTLNVPSDSNILSSAHSRRSFLYYILNFKFSNPVALSFAESTSYRDRSLYTSVSVVVVIMIWLAASTSARTNQL